MNQDLFGQPVLPAAQPKAPEKPIRVGDQVEDFFKRNRYESFTAYQVSCAIGEAWPLDSVKKAIQRLVQGGHVVVTGALGKGRDNEPCHLYIFSTHKRSFK